MKNRRRRKFRFTDGQSKYLIMGGVIALLVLVALISMLRGKTPAQFPFGHTYQTDGTDTPIFYLTADGHLLLESRDRSEFSDAGRFETTESGWTIAPKNGATLRWNLRVEGEEQVILSCIEKGATVTYPLSRVDILSAATAKDSTPLQWFAPGVYDSGSFPLPTLQTADGDTLTFTADTAVDSLTVTAPDGASHTLTGDLTLPARAGIYRVALDGGEYLLQVETK